MAHMPLTPPVCMKCGEIQPPRKRFAFTAVFCTLGDTRRFEVPKVRESHPWIIGRADEGTKGYTPIPAAGLFCTQEAAQDLASKWNKELGWASEADAQMLVLTTMPLKEEELARLLRRACKILGKATDRPGYIEDLDEDADEIREILEEAKPYIKEE